MPPREGKLGEQPLKIFLGYYNLWFKSTNQIILTYPLKKIKKYFMCLFCVLDYSTRVTVLKNKYKVLKYKVLIVSNKCKVLIAKKHENVCQSLLGTEKRTLVSIRYRKT